MDAPRNGARWRENPWIVGPLSALAMALIGLAFIAVGSLVLPEKEFSSLSLSATATVASGGICAWIVALKKELRKTRKTLDHLRSETKIESRVHVPENLEPDYLRQLFIDMREAGLKPLDSIAKAAADALLVKMIELAEKAVSIYAVCGQKRWRDSAVRKYYETNYRHHVERVFIEPPGGFSDAEWALICEHVNAGPNVRAKIRGLDARPLKVRIPLGFGLAIFERDDGHKSVVVHWGFLSSDASDPAGVVFKSEQHPQVIAYLEHMYAEIEVGSDPAHEWSLRNRRTMLRLAEQEKIVHPIPSSKPTTPSGEPQPTKTGAADGKVEEL